MTIRDWSSTRFGNELPSPDGFVELEEAEDVNDSFREIMASIRTWYESAQWIDLGDVPLYVDGSTVKLNGDLTTTYHAGRRVRITDTSGYKYGQLTDATYTEPYTTLSISRDSGSTAFTTEISAIAHGRHSAINSSIDAALIGGGALADKDTIDSDTLIDAGVVTTDKLSSGVMTMEVLDTIAFAGESEKAFTSLSSSNPRLLLVLRNVVLSTNAVVRLIVSSNNGSSYYATNYQYCGVGLAVSGIGSNEFSPSALYIPLSDDITNVVANYALDSMSFIESPVSARKDFKCFTKVISPDSAGSVRVSTMWGRYKNASSIHINAIKVQVSTGNFASGDATLYAVTNG